MRAAMILGYNTNGFAHHRIEDAIEILAEIGYRSIALTLERDFFDPPDRRGVDRAIQRLAPVLSCCQMDVTIETGARFVRPEATKAIEEWIEKHGIASAYEAGLLSGVP